MGQKSKFPTQCLLCLSFSCNLIRFELGKEIEKDVFRDKEKILTHHEESNLRLSDSALRCSTARGLRIFSFVPRLWQDEKHLSLFLYRAKNLSSLLFYLQTWRYLTLLILAAWRTRIIRSCSPKSLWLSGRASERKIRRSEFDSWWGFRIFSLFHARDDKHLSLINCCFASVSLSHWQTKTVRFLKKSHCWEPIRLQGSPVISKWMEEKSKFAS